AKREHIKNLPLVLGQVLGKERSAKRKMEKIDVIAVTVGPGLEPALWTGINFAKDLAKKYKKPLLGTNHLEGHLYSFLLSKKAVYPAIVLIVSGGHTILIYQKNIITWKKIGETRDDAAGEAFDKVARMLNLPYPGGALIEKLALGVPKGWQDTIEFPRPMIHQKNYDFSFSGLKTAVLYYLRDKKKARKRDVAASFQQAIIDVLTAKTIRAAREYKVKSIILAGGVASNNALRKRLQSESRKNELTFLAAEKKYQTDNAAMIAAAAYINYLKSKRHRKIAPRSRGKRRLTAQANLSL
ncbi:MAG: tRNA (adenosine(37)-N6)-threonylcarbamoyltransferase complex transferase subunit TsaD, partial [Candidatus Colwellbacteria bacterium]|nr:tRNA (adenosine(37)-N6)-threonylcarbamoyltransferase complex transferase subunit TsaD [Candidatus Colwellbacteria bacterium]